MRNPEKETELSVLKNVILVPLDITKPEQINATVASITQSCDVDVVFNNAGYGLVGALEACSDEQITEQVNTNLIGAIRLTKAFIPHFREKRKGLFITTTSVFGFSSCPLSPVYNATKWALEGWSESMSYELAKFNIGIKTVAPGGIKTSFINSMTAPAHQEYDTLMARLYELFENGTLIEFNEPETIAGVVYEAATDAKDQLRYLAGTDAIRIAQQRLEKGPEGYRQFLTHLLGKDTLV
jgi:short-subunit dehydrogenase